jgi:hypothetical protein
MRTRPGRAAGRLALAAAVGLGAGLSLGLGSGVTRAPAGRVMDLWDGAAGAATVTSTSTSTSTTAPLSPLATVVLGELGPGYAVTSEGPLDAGSFASNAPDPSAASAALASLGSSITTYQREWAEGAGSNEVQDLLVKFPSTATAQIFLTAMQHSLDSGSILSSGPLAGIPGARTVKYFGATTTEGVGQAITMQTGVYVDLLSFFSASGAAQPITPADAAVLAKAQYAAMKTAPGGTATGSSPGSPLAGDTLGWFVLGVALAAVLSVSVVAQRRRRQRSRTPTG